MERKYNKSAGKVILIMLLILLLCFIGSAVISLIPHNTKLKSLYVLDSKPAEFKYLSLKAYEDDDHAYHYYAYRGTGKIYIDSDTDLASILDDNDSVSSDSLGPQSLKLKLTGIRYFTEDMMGVFVKYPVLVYEYRA